MAFGAALLVVPVQGRWPRCYCRILGVRQLAESTLLLHPSRRVLATGAIVDGIHAVAALAFARRWPRHRWPLRLKRGHRLRVQR